MMSLELEIWISGRWKPVATVEAVGVGFETAGWNGRTRMSYNDDYAIEHFSGSGLMAVSPRYEVDLAPHTEEGWPAFLFDLVPAGAGRRKMLSVLEIGDGRSADWPLLSCALWAPGNLRMAPGSAPAELTRIVVEGPEGFARNEVLQRREDFIEYARARGACVAGSSGAQGDAPKFLMVEDLRGRWHLEGALADRSVARHWLVKLPRGKKERDRIVLRNEAAYLQLAKRLGITSPPHGHEAFVEEDALFFPRFDRRVVDGEVHRFGLESLCSLAGIKGFGDEARAPDAPPGRLDHFVFLDALARYSSSPSEDIQEYLLRDVLNVALGNTDNHGRNTAVLKREDGSLRLSPLYDFAPMYLDDEGIPRATRWPKGMEAMAEPVWGKVAEAIENRFPRLFDKGQMRHLLSHVSSALKTLPEIMRDCGIDDFVVNGRMSAIKAVADQLQELQR